ncbi:MAG TPA: tetratricopeptide repeat protein [Methylotenera sp.]|nr:tetratricopeptide repeat protein [Methylotenera sp.]HPV45812.1 tetratricopeptide repeat protein [Methylotenera sp.]
MSLLIKALDKAQNAKTEQAQAENKTQDNALNNQGADLELSLSPTGSSLAEPGTIDAAVASGVVMQNSSNTASTSPASSANVSSKSAANVFSAKGVEAQNDNKRLALIAGAGLLALLAMGLYFYQFVDTTPDIVIPQRPLEQLAATPQLAPPLEQPENTASNITSTPTETVEPAVPPLFVPAETTSLAEQQQNVNKKTLKKPAVVEGDKFAVAENSDDAGEPEVVIAQSNRKTGKSKTLQMGESIASPSASVSVTKSKSQPSVNPALMSAYEAYNAGNDAEAQKLYKQVLQHDARNVDALLGLGAIAARQGRMADANDWYSKVLEVDPRNNIAQAAVLDSPSQGNEQASESRLKNMLAKRPDDANLHVALGNLYAEQDQWPAAQQAYFEAYRLNASADNAFNLAVSLDQMGKPKLALPYYQRALEQASDTSSIDKAALEARIAAIQ